MEEHREPSRKEEIKIGSEAMDERGFILINRR